MNLNRYKFVMCILMTLISLIKTDHATQAEELSAAPEGSFSIVVIPDTQRYKGGVSKREPADTTEVTNPIFDEWTDWIVANIDKQNIKFVSHVGDIVDKNQRDQWAVARKCMDKLHGKVPYGISVGNHDMVNKTGDSSLFQEVFGQSRFSTFEWYAGCFNPMTRGPQTSGNNANSVQLFEAAGMQFVFLHLECNAPNDVLAWADSVLRKHSNRRAIITTHMNLGPLKRPKKSRGYYEDPKGRMAWKKCHGSRGNTAQEMWDKCFRKHKNLFMICSGDQSRTQAMRQKSKGFQNNVIHELLSDYGKSGIRVMRFLPSKNQIEVRTWDPVADKLCESTKIVPDSNEHQFTLEYNMSAVESN